MPDLIDEPSVRASTTVGHSDSPDLVLSGTVWTSETVRGTGESEINRLAELQHGCVHRTQLEAAGVSWRVAARRVRDGRYVRVHSNVVIVRLNLAGRLTKSMAAVLQLRGNALISGRSAACVWGIWSEPDPHEVEVTLVGVEIRRPTELRVHRMAHLPRYEIRRRHGVPLTSPSRTLLDLAGTLSPLELEAALANARRLNLVRDTEIRRTLACANTRSPGIACLRGLLDNEATARDTRSIYERKLLGLIEMAELPRPVTNVKVAGHLVDMYWPDSGLVVEFDSWTFHRDRRAFETDRRRDQDLAVLGQRVARLTADQIDHHPYATVARLAGALGRPRS